MRGFRNLSSLMMLSVLALSGCVSSQYAAVTAGSVSVAELQVQAADNLWNRAPETMTAHLHSGSEMWTRDGPLLDQLILLSGIGNEGTLFKSVSETVVYPTFSQRMLPNEIVELNQASLSRLFGADALVETSNLRPKRIGDLPATMFDVTISSSDQPKISGRIAAIIHEGKLFEIVFLAAEVYYFEKHWDEALALIESARISLIE